MTARRLTPSEAAQLVAPRDTIAVPLGPGQPAAFLHALGERDDWERLEIFGALLVDLYAVFTKPGVRHLSGFFGPAERFLRDSGADIEFVPSDFRRFEPIVERFHPHVIATAATPPDASGWMSLSLHSGAGHREIKRVIEDPDRLLVVETSPKFPWTYGIDPDYPHRLHVDQVDAIVETDREPFVLADVEPTDVERSIAEHMRPFIHDGATLQTGIGGVPSMVVRLLAQGDGGDYGVHSEMFTTGLMELHKAGKVTNRFKTQFEDFSVTTFAAGTPDLYEWLDGNADVRFLPVEVVNAPEIIARNHDMVTINGALAVDLWGQVVADTLNGRQFSGIGGHEDFVSVSGLELQDRSLICVPSTARVGDTLVSRITATLPEGALVTTPRHQIDVVVTEWGAAHVRGRTVRERALSLAEIAHPDFRDELRERAKTLS
jgi:acyl-CoA hydrolase